MRISRKAKVMQKEIKSIRKSDKEWDKASPMGRKLFEGPTVVNLPSEIVAPQINNDPKMIVFTKEDLERSFCKTVFTGKGKSQ